MLTPDNRTQASRIWDYLVARAGELIPVGGGATRATLIEQLTREGFVIGAAPSFWRDIAALERESRYALGDIKSSIEDLQLHRAAAYEEVQHALVDGRFVQIDGEPGTGKSALLKELANEACRIGRVLVLKDTRIQPKGWAAHAHVLGVSADLIALLREFGCAGDPILFIDGIDKIVDPAIQITVNDVLKAIVSESMLAAWRVVVTVREQNLRHLETWLDIEALKKLPLRTVTVKALNDEEMHIVAQRFPRLGPLLNQAGGADIILRRPFFLDAMLRLAGRAGTTLLPATEIELLTLWWELGGADRSDFSPAQHRRNLLMDLAKRLVAAPSRAINVSNLSPEAIGDLRSAGILRDKDLGHSVVFAHDIYEEWVLCELLIREASDLQGFLKNHAESDTLIRPVQLLGPTSSRPDQRRTICAQRVSHQTGRSRPAFQRLFRSIRAPTRFGRGAPVLSGISYSTAISQAPQRKRGRGPPPNTLAVQPCDFVLAMELRPCRAIKTGRAASDHAAFSVGTTDLLGGRPDLSVVSRDVGQQGCSICAYGLGAMGVDAM